MGVTLYAINRLQILLIFDMENFSKKEKAEQLRISVILIHNET
jgi:hypothetical protein